MKNLVDMAGSVVAALGVIACVAAGLVRVLGVYELAGYELRTLFMVGTGLMVMGCLAKLHVIGSELARR